MTPADLRAALTTLYGDGSDRELAMQAAPVFRVHWRSIIKWLDGDRGVPGPAAALLDELLRQRAGTETGASTKPANRGLGSVSV